MKHSILAVLAVVACASHATAGQVIVVGSAPNQVANLQAAVDAAIDGDVILVKAGTYSTFSIPNKSVTIVSDFGQVVNVTGAARVRNLDAGRKVLIAGLKVTGQFNSNTVEGHGFFATNCAGAVRVQDCTLTGFNGGGPCGATPGAGAQVTNCADVSFVRCTLTGSGFGQMNSPSSGHPPDSMEGTGLVASSSSVALHETTARGGEHGLLCNGYFDGADGGSGASIRSSFVFGSRSAFGGGMGTSVNVLLAFAGDGGPGVEIRDAVSSVHFVQCTVGGGGGGVNPNCGLCGSCCSGTSGPSYWNLGAPPDVIAATAPSLSAVRLAGTPTVTANVARELSSLTLTILGTAGDRATLAIARDAHFVFDPNRAGVELAGQVAPEATRYLILGTFAPDGTLTATLPMPAIPATDPGRTLWMQLATTSPNGTSKLGSPLSIVVLDSAY